MRHLLTAMGLACTLAASASTENGQKPIADNDTTTINTPRKVVIITGDSLQKITVIGKENDEKYRYENTIQLVDSNYTSTVTISKDWNVAIGIGKKDDDGESRCVITSDLGFGMTAPTSVADGIDFSTGSSWEIFWTIAQFEYHPKMKSKHHAHWFSAGFGVDWKNYRMTGNRQFVLDDNRHVALAAYPYGASPKFSRIKVFSLNVPILWNETFGRNKDWGFSLGPVINFNTYASIKTRYKIDGGSFKKVEKDIPQRPVTLELMGIARTPLLDFYIKYSPTTVLKSGQGPAFKSLSFGIYL